LQGKPRCLMPPAVASLGRLDFAQFT